MDEIPSALREWKTLEDEACGASFLHRRHPLAKGGVVIAGLFVMASVSPWAWGEACALMVFPAVFFGVGRLSVRQCLWRLRFVLPCVLLMGVFNPVFDTEPWARVGGVVVTRGMVSLLTLALKGVFCLLLSYGLIATTRMDALCVALRRVHVPEMLATLLLLTHRYVVVLLEEVGTMTQAYRLRAPRARGVHVSAWGTFLGQLLLRSMDRAQEVHRAMELRGFRGTMPDGSGKPWGWRDSVFVGVSVVGLLLLKKGVGLC